MKTIKITEQPNKKTSELLKMCRSKFPVWLYCDDTKLDTEFPAPKEASTRYFLDEQEPDTATLGLSVREAEAKGFTNGITLRERILLELAYFDLHQKHLDPKGVTFCSGSRNSDGGVPDADWSGDKFRVDWYDLDFSCSAGGVRSAVSLDSISSNPLDEDLQNAIEIVKSNGYKVIKEV